MRFLRPRRWAVVGLLAVVIVGLWAAAAGADTVGPDVPGGVGGLAQDLNLLWVCIGGALVMFMQAGFALVETGFTRKKNAAHTMGMNVAIFGTAFTAFFVVGYALMFGGYSFPHLFGYDTAIGSDLVGSGNWVLLWQGSAVHVGRWRRRPAVLAFFFYMAAFMDATATIPTGAMAERWKWNNFVVWGFFCGALYYPLFGSWTWGGGWLAKLGASVNLGHGYVDFAGSGVVHAMGGVAALAGAIVLGPRIGKYRSDGTPQRDPRSQHPDGAPRRDHPAVRVVRVQRRVDAGGDRRAVRGRSSPTPRSRPRSAPIISMFYVMKRLGKPDPGMFGNGLLAGLVAITAPCAFVSPWAAALIGSIAGDLRGRSRAVHRPARCRRPGRRGRGARRERHLGRHRGRAVREREVRRRLERNGGRGRHQDRERVGPLLRSRRRGPARRPTHRRRSCCAR